MSRTTIALLCITLFSSCAFFKREPLSEEEIRNYIFLEDTFNEVKMDISCKGAVGGYGFIVRIKDNAVDQVLETLDGFALDGRFSENDPNKTLITEIFKSSVAQHFSVSNVPKWIPKEATCKDGVSRYTKNENTLIIYAYHGVGECDELFFIGSLE